jgi:guanylate kinase
MRKAKQNDIIKINKVKTTYELIKAQPVGHDKEYGRRTEIIVDVDWNGRLTVKTASEQREFVFKESKPQVVKDIGELLIEASKLIADEGKAKIIK